MEHTTKREDREDDANSDITDDLDIEKGVSRERMKFHPTQPSDRDKGKYGNTRRKDSDCVVI